MQAVLKKPIASSFLALLMFVPTAGASPADAPLPRRLAASSGGSKGMPLGVPRLLWRREVLQAIQNDLAKKGIRAGGSLRLEDLRIQSAVPAFKDDLGLQVKSIGFDAIRRETVFNLWASNEPQYLPFEVTTRRDPRSLGLAQLPNPSLGEVAGRSKGALQRDSGQQLDRARNKPTVLAKPGKLATLVMLGQNMRITTTVVPLQPGSKGQCIRVRDSATARIMTAEVVDEGLLRASF